MRAVIQVVNKAQVDIDNECVGSCGKGYLLLLGVGPDDTVEVAQKLWDKIYKMRVFSDQDGKTNLSLNDIAGEVLIVSQFTLYANCRKGNRPSFTQAAKPQLANELYEKFLDIARRDVEHVAHGEFGADMQVSLVNDGPFTIVLDTDDFLKPRRS